MVKALDKAELARLITVVEGKLAKLPTETSDEALARFHFEAGEALRELAVEEKARTGSSTWDRTRLTMGGITTTCTYGAAGVLNNWLAAAKRQLEVQR